MKDGLDSVGIYQSCLRKLFLNSHQSSKEKADEYLLVRRNQCPTRVVGHQLEPESNVASGQ